MNYAERLRMEDWVKANAYTPDCCPDPDSNDMLDHAEPFSDEDGQDIYAIIASAGYEPRLTPVDTLMAAPYGLGLSVADAMENFQ